MMINYPNLQTQHALLPEKRDAGQICRYSFDASGLTGRLERFLENERVSPAVVFILSAAILIHRYSRETSVPLISRSGSLSNEFTVDLSLSTTVHDGLRQISDKLGEIASIHRPGNNGLLELVLPWQLMRPLMRVADAGNLPADQVELALACTSEGSCLSFTFHYRESTYDSAVIAQMSEHLLNLLAELTKDPKSRCIDLQMLSAEEINRTVYEWNSPQSIGDPRCFQELFADRVTKTPHSKALMCQDDVLTYAELNSKANVIADLLCRVGAKPEIIVGIGMGRSVKSIVSIVGILKTGAAYCAIDPDYPLVRIEEMIKEAGTAIILTDTKNINRFEASGLHVINMDEICTEQTAAANVCCRVTLDHAAYVTFTSGSTGKPKGVVGTHRSIAVLNDLARRFYGDDEIGCLNAPLGFSSAIATLLMSLSCGMPLAVIPEGQEKDPRTIALSVQRHKITILSMAPSLLRQLFSLGSAGREMLSTIRRIGLSGAEISWDMVESFRQIMPNAAMSLGYASSETCAVVLGNLVNPEEKDRSGRISLGRPGLHNQVLVLDENLQPVPIGAPGELYVASAHLSRGYIGQPARTAERFLPNPFGRSPGERMYRTGDIVRYRFDGEIEFLGRSDNQVKIRGFRVELEEIEAALVKHADIGEAVVVAEKSETSERLVAYIVRKGAGEINISELRNYLEQYLPFYMIPSIFHFLDSLPMTPNGKIDRKALPSTPNAAIPDLQNESARDPIEEALIHIWQTSLGIDRIGIQDEFLDLGGESLIAAQIVQRIRENFGIEIPVPMFFEELTVAALAVEISRIQQSSVQHQSLLQPTAL